MAMAESSSILHTSFQQAGIIIALSLKELPVLPHIPSLVTPRARLPVNHLKLSSDIYLAHLSCTIKRTKSVHSIKH